jgi:hypothetical protein
LKGLRKWSFAFYIDLLGIFMHQHMPAKRVASAFLTGPSAGVPPTVTPTTVVNPGAGCASRLLLGAAAFLWVVFVCTALDHDLTKNHGDMLRHKSATEHLTM